MAAKSVWEGVVGVAWLDFETTGLDPDLGQILEVYAEAHPLGSTEGASYGQVLALTNGGAARLQQNTFVQNMHTCSGLLLDCSRATALEHEVSTGLASWLTNVQGKRQGKWLLAGNSVHFDLGFARKRMPAFASLLHHRVLDVSGLMLDAEQDGCPLFEGEAAHRAFDDVQRSKAMYKHIKAFRSVGVK